MLRLGNYKGQDEQDIVDDVADAFCENKEKLSEYDFLVAYSCEDGYEGQHYLLLRKKSDGELYENEASHCSCNDYNGCFTPDRVNKEYLLKRLDKSVSLPFGSYYESEKADAAAFRALVEAL